MRFCGGFGARLEPARAGADDAERRQLTVLMCDVVGSAALSQRAAREFDNTVFAGVAPSPDLDWLRACVNFLARRDF